MPAAYYRDKRGCARDSETHAFLPKNGISGRVQLLSPKDCKARGLPYGTTADAVTELPDGPTAPSAPSVEPSVEPSREGPVPTASSSPETSPLHGPGSATAPTVAPDPHGGAARPYHFPGDPGHGDAASSAGEPATDGATADGATTLELAAEEPGEYSAALATVDAGPPARHHGCPHCADQPITCPANPEHTYYEVSDEQAAAAVGGLAAGITVARTWIHKRDFSWSAEETEALTPGMKTMLSKHGGPAVPWMAEAMFAITVVGLVWMPPQVLAEKLGAAQAPDSGELEALRHQVDTLTRELKALRQAGIAGGESPAEPERPPRSGMVVPEAIPDAEAA